MERNKNQSGRKGGGQSHEDLKQQGGQLDDDYGMDPQSEQGDAGEEREQTERDNPRRESGEPKQQKRGSSKS